MTGSLPTADAPMRRVQRALAARLDAGIAGLSHGPPTDREVHAVREALKRARAALRLLRACIGEADYRLLNARVRDAARPLTKVRDSKVLLQTLRSLEHHARAADPAISTPRAYRSFLRSLARDLRRQQRLPRRRLAARRLHAAAAALGRVKRRIEGIPQSRLVRGTLAAPLERAYRTARRSHARVVHEATDEGLHEWRKQTKYMLHQLEFVLGRGPVSFSKRRKRTRRLAHCLGDDHDLVLLNAQVLAFARGARRAAPNIAAAELLRRIARRRGALQSSARRLGRQLYSEKPAHLRKKFERSLGAASA